MKFRSALRTAVTTFTLALACVFPAQAQSVSGQGTWETTLLGRDINRNAVAATDVSAVYLYDTTLNVTWLRDANANGRMNWDAAVAWAANLTTGSGAAAISDWRLPTMTDTGPSGCDWSYGGTDCGFNPETATSEMAHLFFNTLGNKAAFNINGQWQVGYGLNTTGLTNAGSFRNMQSSVYLFGTEYAPDSTNTWYFSNGGGSQGFTSKSDQFYALAVRPGDVSPAPEPETYAMLLAGLAMVGGMSRRRKQQAATT